MQVNKPPRNRRKRFTLAAYILLGVVLGILSGIFFGEYCAPLGIIGNAFIGLLQMTILPFIIVSLILAIGSLRYDQAGLLAVKAGVLQRLSRDALPFTFFNQAGNWRVKTWTWPTNCSRTWESTSFSSPIATIGSWK